MTSDIHPDKGTRLRVFWVGEKRWFRGAVTKTTIEDGNRIHQILYEDGDSKWHNLADELWLELPVSAKDATSKGKGKESAAAKPSSKASSAASGASNSAAKRPAASSSSDAAEPSPPPKKKAAAPSAAKRAPSPPAKGPKQPKRSVPAGPLPPDFFGQMPEGLPPLIGVDPSKVDVFPCGVIRVRDAVPLAERQRLWDAVVCGGFDFRDVAASNGQNRNGANMWYTQAAGAPDILLHFNYYEPPVNEQPPPMALLCAADAVFHAATKLEAAHHALEPAEAGEAGGEVDGEETDEHAASNDGASTHGAASSDDAGATGAAADAADASDVTDGKKPPRKSKKIKEPWVDEAAADAATLAENVAKKEAAEMKALLWPRKPNFRSVLAIGYRPTDTFRWHTDLAGEDGWVCSISVGATAVFEYLPTPAPSALRRARAYSDGEGVVKVEVGSGDALLFHGGLLAHRLSAVEPQPDAAKLAGCHMAPYVRLNLQVRVFGADADTGLHELLERGFRYVH